MAVAINYITQVTDTDNLTTYTFSNVPIGAAAASRLVVVGVGARRDGAREIASATIAGSAASILAQTSGQNQWVGLIARRVPNGTTATITVTHTAQALACSIGVWSVTGAEETPFDTDAPNGGSDSSRSVTLTTPAGGGAIVCCVGNGGFNWTNISPDFDVAVEASTRHSGGYKVSATILSGQTISVTNARAIVGASWSASPSIAPKMMHYRRLRV